MLYAGYYERSEMMNNINIRNAGTWDAGKTTLSESLLYVSGSIRQLGRVDHGNALDYAQERIAVSMIYAKQAILTGKDICITLLDTPGHVDFSRNVECASGAGLCSGDHQCTGWHTVPFTETIWKLLQHYMFCSHFVNKMDVSHTECTDCVRIETASDEHCVDVTLQDEACQSSWPRAVMNC